MNDPTSALQSIPAAAVVGPFLGLLVTVLGVTARAFMQAQKVQSEVNSEKNRTIERQQRENDGKQREIESRDREIERLRHELSKAHDREQAKDLTIYRLRSDLRRLDPSGESM